MLPKFSVMLDVKSLLGLYDVLNKLKLHSSIKLPTSGSYVPMQIPDAVFNLYCAHVFDEPGGAFWGAGTGITESPALKQIGTAPLQVLGFTGSGQVPPTNTDCTAFGLSQF